MNVKRIATLLVLVVCATAIAVVPAFATTTNQVSITDLAVALSASDDFPPEPWMFTEGSDFGRAPYRQVLDAWGRPVYLDFSRQPVSQLPNGDFIRIIDWDTGLGDEDLNGDPITVPDYEIWGPAYRFPSDGNEYTFGDPLPGFELVGRGPHGGYTTTSAKCAVCHSAHTAAIGEGSFDRGGELTSSTPQPRGYALLRQGSTGCEYCHLTGSPVGAAGMSSRIVYTAGSEIAGLELSNLEPISGHEIGFSGPIPKSDGLTINNLTCSTCHTVHGNIGTWQPREFFTDNNDETVTVLGYRMLRVDPGRAGNIPRTESADPASPATEQDQVNQFTLGTWCMSCHNDTNSMDKFMTSLRIPNDFTSFDDAYRTTAFTVTDSNVHSEDSFAVEYDDPNLSVDAAPHPTTFLGVYSGPGQCYTCHRGDLGGPLGEEWRWTTAEGDDVALGDVEIGEFARLQALGYFGVDTSPLLPEQQAQLNQNLTCSGCHFGTADYALWAPRSDWPHSSPNTDRMLLGMNLDGDGIADFNAGGSQRSAAIAENFCSRCHFPYGEEPNSFLISRHFFEHSDVNLEGIEGILGILSPGRPQNDSSAP